VGPLLSVILFTIWDHGFTAGDDAHWPMAGLRIVMLIGLGLQIPCALVMFCFRDDQALGKASRGVAETAEEPSEQNSLYEALDPGDDAGDAELPSKEAPIVTTKEEAAWELWMAEARQMRGCCCLTVKHIPHIVFTSDFVMNLASGMTIKFFPLFFKTDCKMSPAEVQTIYFVVPIAMALCSKLGTRLAMAIGRVQAILVIRALGLSCFVAMVVLYHFGHIWLVVVAYVMRTALMNCAYPLRESILMDYVAKDTRARWKSLESVTIFGWCGSAAFGGYLADVHSYTFTFIITIIIQCGGALIYFSLISLVSKKRPQDLAKEAAEFAAVKNGIGNAVQGQPNLQVCPLISGGSGEKRR